MSLNAKYTETVPALFNGIVSPDKNVATVEMGAAVVKGISRVKNNLLSGNVTNCSYLGNTSHQLGNGEILVQLGQPYIIGSLRLCLWNLRAVRESSFFIETSMDSKKWEMAVDKREERLSSVQKFDFSPRPASYVKIVGTYTSATEVR